MSTNEEKQLDEFTRKIISDAGLERPSSIFLNNLMTKIQSVTSPVITYKPLIGKWVWWLIGVVMAALIFTVFNTGISESAVWDKLLPGLRIKPLHISENLVFIAVVASLCILAEVILIRDWHNKRLSKG